MIIPVPRMVLVPIMLALTVAGSACGDSGNEVATGRTDAQSTSSSSQAVTSIPDPEPFIQAVHELPYFATSGASASADGPGSLDRLADRATGVVTGTFQEVRPGETTTIRAADLVDVENEDELPFADSELITSHAEILVTIDENPGVTGTTSGEVVAVPVPLAMRPVGLLGPTPEEMVATLQEVAPTGARMVVFTGEAALPGAPADNVGAAGAPVATPLGLDAVVFENTDGSTVSLNQGGMAPSQVASGSPGFEAFAAQAREAITS